MCQGSAMEQLTTGAGVSAAGKQDISTLDGWQQAGKWFSYGGHAIFSRMAGQGEPLVLLHGFPTASWDWSRVWPMLARHYNLLTYNNGRGILHELIHFMEE